MWEEAVWFFKDYAESILAVCAILLTIQQSWVIRRHNKLSVRPMLTVFTHRHHSLGMMDVQTVLTNSGLGPAYIRTFEYLLDGTPIAASTSEQAIVEIQKSTAIPILNWRMAVLRPKHVIAKEASQELINVKLAECAELTHEELERFQIRIVYESAYGEVFIYDSRRHQ